MRLASIIPAVLAVLFSSPVYAQAWEEFTDRQEHFTVNFPGDPKVESITYKSEKGASLPAKVYTAKDARGGEYKLTVVNYTSATAEAGKYRILRRYRVGAAGGLSRLSALQAGRSPTG